MSQRSARRAGATACVCLALLLATAIDAHADWFFVSKIGMSHLEEIRKAIQPAPLFEETRDGAVSRWYARGILEDIIGPAQPGPPAKTMSYEEVLALIKKGEKFGTGIDPTTRIKFFAFGKGGAPRSPVVDLPAEWFQLGLEPDGARDLRLTFGNYDEAYGVPLASRRYSERILAAIDADGSLGLRPPGLGGAAPRVPVEHGFAVEIAIRARVPPDRQAPLIAAYSARLNARDARLGLHETPFNLTQDYLRAIAIERRYRLEPGFAEGASSGIEALLRFGSVAGDLGTLALSHVDTLIRAAEAVQPGTAFPGYDGAPLADAVRAASEALGWRLDVADPDTLARVLAEFKSRTSGLGEPPDAPNPRFNFYIGGRDPQLPVDPSEVADVALKFLIADPALCFVSDDFIERIARMSLGFARTVVYPDPRANDRMSLKPAGRQLMLRLLNPPRAADRRTADACARTANVARRQVVTIAQTGVQRMNSGERLFALDLLQESGWAPKAELDDWVWRFQNAAHYFTVREQPEPADPVARARRRNDLAGLADAIRIDARVLSRVLDLERSAKPDLRAVGAAVRQWLERITQTGTASEQYVADQVRALRNGG